MPDTNIATYNLQIFSPTPQSAAPSLNERELRVLADLPAIMEAAEETLTNQLPEGFEARITEWHDA